MIKKRNPAVENAFMMLKYIYFEIRSKRFKNFDYTKYNNLDELYSAIISLWGASLAKEGLYKEYVEIEDEEMTTPIGQINAQASISQQTKSRGTLICSYDELSDNIYINQVIKGTLLYVMAKDSVTESVKTEIKKTLQMYNSVDSLDIKYAKWKDIKFNNNNIRYKHIIEISKNYILESNLEKSGLIDEQRRLYLLFKKQIEKFLFEKYGEEDDVSCLYESYISYDYIPEFERRIERMQKLSVITTGEHAMMICIRFQDSNLVNDPKAARAALEDVVAYMRDYVADHKVKMSAVLMYVNTDPKKLNLQDMTVNVVSDYTIGETTIDIYDQWRYIENKIHNAYKHFIKRFKDKDDKKKNNQR